MTILLAHVRVKPGKLDQAIADSAANRDASVLEPGCVEFGFFQQPDDPQNLVFVERWRDQAALQEHFETPHFGAFMAAAEGWLEGAPVGGVYTASDFEPLAL